MQESVKQRIKTFIKYKNISIREFERNTNLSNGYINGIDKTIMPNKMSSISRQYPELNSGWVLTGEGEMLKSNYSAGRDNIIGNSGSNVNTGSGNITNHNGIKFPDVLDHTLKDWREMYLKKEKQVEYLKTEMCNKINEFVSDIRHKDQYIEKIISKSYQRNESKDIQIGKLLDEISELRKQCVRLTEHFFKNYLK